MDERCPSSTSARMAKRRTAGSIRRVASGRWQARMRAADGRMVSLGCFDRRRDAEDALATASVDERRGMWVDPRRGRVALRDYATDWVESRPDALTSRTQELYRSILRNHVFPQLGDMALADLAPAGVRRWHAGLRAKGLGAATSARAYALLRAICSTAVREELIVRNPCNMRGVGNHTAPERPIATVEEVFVLAEGVEPRFRALVLTAAFTGLRSGELFGLRRRDVDLAGARVHVVEQLQSLADGTLERCPPKTAAGRRTVSLPAALVPDLEAHLAAYTGPDLDALVFTGAGGAPLRRNHWGAKWRSARSSVGLGHLRFHDLRHTGNTLAASTGASLKELMSRMGHASPRAALLYQHATDERDRHIAEAMSSMIEERVSERKRERGGVAEAPDGRQTTAGP